MIVKVDHICFRVVRARLRIYSNKIRRDGRVVVAAWGKTTILARTAHWMRCGFVIKGLRVSRQSCPFWATPTLRGEIINISIRLAINTTRPTDRIWTGICTTISNSFFFPIFASAYESSPLVNLITHINECVTVILAFLFLFVNCKRLQDVGNLRSL